MLKNYFKVAWRNLFKHKFFSILNITGLAIAMAVSLTVILIIREELSYDHFHPLSDRIYRINCLEESGNRVATVPEPLGNQLAQQQGMVEASVRLLRNLNGVDATTDDHLTLPISGFFTEPSFFEVFGFQMEAGNPSTALEKPNSIVLSQEMATRFFGTTNPVGQNLNLKDLGIYQITGVISEPPGKTHLRFGALASYSSLQELGSPDEQSDDGAIIGNWENFYMTYVYVLLGKDQSANALEQSLDRIAEDRKKASQNIPSLVYEAHPFHKISPRRGRISNDLAGGAMFFIWGLLAFMGILTIFPCINYAGMAIARILSRTKEVGVRRTLGADNGAVRRLFMTEAVLTAILALLLGYVMHLPITSFVAKFFPPEAHLENLAAQPSDILTFLGYALIIGLLAGWAPSFRATKLQPAIALKGNSSGAVNQGQRFSWRKILITLQFVISLVFIMVVITIWQQMHYMSTADYGFEKENVLVMSLQGNDPQLVASELRRHPKVLEVGGSSVKIASHNLQSMNIQLEPGKDPFGIQSNYVDEHYIPAMGMQLVAGENFAGPTNQSHEEWIILNEKAVDQFGLGQPSDAIGQKIWLDHQTPATIRGVVKDFHYRTLEYGIEPVALRYTPTPYASMLNIRVASGPPQQTITGLESIWKSIDHIHPMEVQFMDESIEQAYQHLIVASGITGFFAIMSLLLAGMGLLGMVTYTIQTKIKELGIRKVLGATASGLAFFISKQFLILTGIALMVAWPLGYWLSNLFLQMFSFRVDLGGTVFASGLLLLILTVLLTVGIQAFRAAMINPVDSLRNE